MEDSSKDVPTGFINNASQRSQGLTEVEVWREVHARLIDSVRVAQNAVAAKKLQRRFWLEEVCANLSDSGKVLASSVWNRPVPPKKTQRKTTKAKAAAKTTKKRKKEASEKAPRAKKARKTKTSKTEIDDKGNEDTAGASGGFNTQQLPSEFDANSANENTGLVPSGLADSSEEEDEKAIRVQETASDSEDEDLDVNHEGTSTEKYSSSKNEEPSTTSHPRGHKSAGDQPPYSYAHAMHDQYSGFYSDAGGTQSGLSSTDFYSTYSGPPAEHEEAVEEDQDKSETASEP